MSDYINFGAFDFMSEHQQAASSSRPDLEAMLANYPLDFNANPGLSDSLAVGDDSTGTDYVDESNVRSANSGFSNSFGRFDFDNVDYSYQNGVIPHPMPLTSPSAGGFTQGTIDPKQLVLSPFACSFVVTTSHGGVQRNATNINNPGALSNFTFQQSRQQYSANSPGPASYAALPVGARPQIPTPRPVCTAGPNMHDTLGEAHGTSLPGWSPGDSEAQPLQHAFLNDRVCSECSLTFPAQASRSSPSLVKHAAQSKHKSFGCICGNSYNRKDVLKRHIIAADGAQSDIYCHLCARSFGRKDHLTQHLRGFHHGDFRVFDLLAKHSGIHTGAPGLDRDSIYVCPHAGCPANRSEAWIAAQSVSGSDQWPFKSFLTFYLHMAHIHDEIAYTCPAESCSRLKGKYFRFPETFENHCRVEHKVEVKAERREEFLPFCARAGCGLRLVQGQYSWLFRCPNSVEDKKDQYGYIQWRHL